jgi:hypothetical protein
VDKEMIQVGPFDDTLLHKPENGFVPDAATALKIAEAILVSIYGQDSFDGQKPYEVKLNENEVWEISGTLPEWTIGGVAYIEIQKSDSKILKVIHGE